ncbi:MAG: hypothetical protein J5931_10020 [Prevotella sp.]|nr:hypothetical protein [Prevotella sp.]
MKTLMTVALAVMTLCSYANKSKENGDTLTFGPYFSEPEVIMLGDGSFPDSWNGVLTDGDRAMSRSGLSGGKRWIDRINNMPAYMRDFYDEYASLVGEVINGGKNWLADPSLADYSETHVPNSVSMNTFTGEVEFTYPQDAETSLITESAKNAVREVCNNYLDEFNCFIPYLMLCLSNDFPETFWLGKKYMFGNSYTFRFEKDTAGNKGTAKYSLNIYFFLKDNDFDRRIDYFADTQAIYDAIDEYNSKVDKILNDCPDGSRYDKILYINDWLTQHNCYNTSYGVSNNDLSDITRSSYSTMMELSDSDGPVCEAYSRACKYLCDKLDIPCVITMGYARDEKNSVVEPHMWNEVQMENGKWYAVDVTWNDPTAATTEKKSGMENHDWLLLGKNDIVADNFTFAESHPNSLDAMGFSADDISRWDFSIASLIADTGYNSSTHLSPVLHTGISLTGLFDLNGRRVNESYNGIIIVKQEDGKASKIIKKCK